VIADTTFLIDVEREIAQRQPARAMEFLSRHHARTLRISVITLGELAEGYADPEDPSLAELTAPYGVIEITLAIARKYAAISRSLRSSGGRWGDNDLWIAATALDAGEPLVTRDLEHFSRIQGLEVLHY
jgi:predicted nucleic acid-binding protein